ncbi:tetratricopeptide repeat protein [Streptomyces sp. NPDC056244]|uniref:tetratricopeptide repeat protein n=1 Tax=Streptomyces sp. NPDC056244 TaxID=3345762 RepID=UPI0035E2C3DC
MTSIDQAYTDLPPEAAAAFRRLGHLPGRHSFNPDVVAAVCAVDRTEATRLLEILLSASLVQDLRADGDRNRPLTCGFHDAVRALARERAGEEPQAVREVLRRWVEWYLFAATAAEARLTPSHRTMPRTPRYIVTGPALFDQDTDQEVVEWLDRHRADLLAAADLTSAARWHDLGWQLPDAMWPLFRIRRHHEDWVTVHEEIGLPAAEQDRNRPAVRRMLTTLGGGLRSLGRYDEALEQYGQALTSARQDKARQDEAQALDGIGEVHRQAGRTSQAVTPLIQALAIRKKIGYVRGAALTRLKLGQIAADSGKWHDALTHLTRARFDLRGESDPYDAARALAHMGRTYTLAGHYAEGIAHLRRAEQEFTAAGSRHWQARTREWTGAAAYNQGRTKVAREHLTAAREMYEHLHSTRDIARIDQHLLALDEAG